MTSKSAPNDMTPEDRAVFGYGRVRNAAYEAVQALWRRRKSEGLTQLQLGERIARDPARVSKYLRGPGNWTLRTFGELVAALDGEAEIIIHAIEDPVPDSRNYDAYAEVQDTGSSIKLRAREGKGTDMQASAPKLVSALHGDELSSNSMLHDLSTQMDGPPSQPDADIPELLCDGFIPQKQTEPALQALGPCV